MADTLFSSENATKAEEAKSESQERKSSIETSTVSPLSFTASSGSVLTVRAKSALQSPNAVLRTPSFPFPPVGISSATPLETPPTHSSFMALSPTLPPDSRTPTDTRAAKSKVVGAFKVSGGIAQSESRLTTQASNEAQTLLPDLYDLSIRLQTEPGLSGWWQQTTQILKESCYAIRATLAVPSDKTEIENVPWAQLAEFAASIEGDNSSQTTLEAGSTRNSISGSFTSESTSIERFNDNPSILTPTGNSRTHTRPKLNTRHSYAGYPQKLSATEASISLPKRPQPKRSETQGDLIGRISESQNQIDLEQLGYSYRERVLSPLSEFTSSSSLHSARVLVVQRPLEADTEPLITTAGVSRVLNNSSATILTRRYNVPDQTQEDFPGSRVLPSRESQSQPHVLPSSDSKAFKALKSSRSSIASNTKSSSASKSGINRRSNDQSNGFRTPYEDFEQVPGTPWAQSPAPSPAAMAETEENPFFSPMSVKESFQKNPPNYQYTSGQQFEAIGMDQSHSIIQLPLIHPSSILSQPQRLHRSRVERGKGKKANRREKSSSSQKQSPSRKRKVPLAILSILAPVVPFPQDHIQFLSLLAPMLATSFYAASQYSSLQTEVNGLTFERNRMMSGASPSLLHTTSASSDMFSPLSSNSTEYLASESMLQQGHQEIRTEAPFTESQKSKARTPGARTPASITSQESYFEIQTDALESTSKQGGTPHHSSAQSKSGSAKGPKKNHTTLHSQGATFHKTHPSQPVAMAMGQSEDDQSGSDKGSGQFREPSSSMLRSMIDIGATQHLIAEPESGRILWVNSKFQAYRNNSSGQKLDDELWNSIYVKDRKNFRREWLHALENGEQLSQQVRMERFDGQFRWFHLKFLPLKNNMGVIKYWSGQAMDIHDLHEAEVKAAKSKEKTASEARYRAIANSLPVIVFAASVSTGMTFANTQWLSYSGQSLSQALGFGFLEHVHPEDLDKCRFPGISSDVATSNSSEQDSRSSIGNAALQRTISSASSAGESDAISAVTERTDSTLRPTAHGKQDEELDEPEIPNELLKTLAKEGIIVCARDGQGNLSITTEMRLKSKDDEYRWHLVQGSYIESVNFGQGDAQWFIACTDISAQKKNESKIQQANAALENANSALGREMQQKMGYLSSMSHEIRTPLNSIIGNLQFLIQSSLEESALEWAHSAKEAATGMHELINDILDLSKAEAKMLKLQAHWFSPRDLAEEIADILNPKAAGKKVELSQETAPDVPFALRGDSGRIKQVLLNLATNAIKFTNEGEVVVRCELLHEMPSAELGLAPLKENEVFVRWVVTDTGIGFTEADKKLLFKAYSQIRNKATRDTVGTGLGLILCKTMVNLHGGEIDASSVPGKGSTFSFFARFRTRHDATGVSTLISALPSPAIIGSPGGAVRTDAPQTIQSPTLTYQESPAPLSDGSSALSMKSSIYQKSIRSSISTLDSPRPQSPLKLSLPSDEAVSTSIGSVGLSNNLFSPTVSNRAQRQHDSSGVAILPKAGSTVQLTAPLVAEPHTQAEISQITPSSKSATDTDIKQDENADSDRANFRPPMLSVLVICPSIDTRRITCDRIQDVVPRSAPCNIASESTFAAAYELLFGAEPFLFTHIVIRSVNDADVLECVDKTLGSSIHSKTCIIVITDQDQFTTIKEGLPQVDFLTLNQTDRVKKVLKPAHASKLAKIFDPFNENRTSIDGPKENKRKAGERRTKEDFKLFKKALGGKGLRVVAVEDDKMQMTVRTIPFLLINLLNSYRFSIRSCLRCVVWQPPWLTMVESVLIYIWNTDQSISLLLWYV